MKRKFKLYIQKGMFKLGEMKDEVNHILAMSPINDVCFEQLKDLNGFIFEYSEEHHKKQAEEQLKERFAKEDKGEKQ